MNKVPDEIEISKQEEQQISKSIAKQTKKKNKKSKKTSKIKMDKQLIITIICCSIVLILFGIYAYHKLTGPYYTVSFNSDGGTKVASQKVHKNKNATRPKNPTKENYLFLRWEYNGKEYRFEEGVTKNITLKAIWEESSTEESTGEPTEDLSNTNYMVIFDSKGGTKIEDQNVLANSTVTKPEDPTKDHATFKYWTVNNEEYDFNTPVTKDMFIVAEWDEETKLSVSYDSDGGSKVTSQKLYANELATKPTDPTKKDYKFLGWYLDNALYDFNAPVTKNMILVAKWEKIKTYVVTFDNDGYLTTANVTEGKTVAKPTDPTREGYTFGGWYLNDTAFDFNTPITSDISLKANWVQ